ncbi:hypothetical protein HDR58_05955 [bacterium]|nr:hypothetical protein [bacterium]
MSKDLNYANWLYFIGTKENPTQIFIYGLSIPTKCPIEYSLNIEDKGSIKSGTHLYLFRSVKRINEIVIGNNIDLAKIYSDDKHILPNRQFLNFITQQHFIQKYESCPVKHGIQSPIGSLVSLNCYYSKEFFETDFNNEEIIHLLQKLAEDTNQDFYGDYSRRVGCFEILETQPWAESMCPFYIEYNKDEKQYYFVKEKNFNEDVTLLFKRYYSKEEKVFEKLIFIQKNQQKVSLNSTFNDDLGFEYSVYNVNGELLHKDYVIFLKTLSMKTTINGGTRKIKDKFSKKDNNLEIIPLSTEIKSIIKSPDIDKEISFIKDSHENLLNIIIENKVSEKEGQWFNKSKNVLSDIVNYLNSLHVQSSEVIIVDPYADDDTIPLAIRLKTSKIKIISSCKSLPKQVLANNTERIKLIKEQLNNMNYNTNTIKYYFINKNFHDRFIMFKNGKEIEIYCLPNSLNAMLKNDDFLILRLNGKVKQQAILHINQLNSLCDNKNLLENIKNDID